MQTGVLGTAVLILANKILLHNSTLLNTVILASVNGLYFQNLSSY